MLNGEQQATMQNLINTYVDAQVVLMDARVALNPDPAAQLTAAKAAGVAMWTGFGDNFGIGLYGKNPVTSDAETPEQEMNGSIGLTDDGLAAMETWYSALANQYAALLVKKCTPPPVTGIPEAIFGLKLTWLQFFHDMGNYAYGSNSSPGNIVCSKAPSE